MSPTVVPRTRSFSQAHVMYFVLPTTTKLDGGQEIFIFLLWLDICQHVWYWWIAVKFVEVGLHVVVVMRCEWRKFVSAWYVSNLLWLELNLGQPGTRWFSLDRRSCSCNLMWRLLRRGHHTLRWSKGKNGQACRTCERCVQTRSSWDRSW